MSSSRSDAGISFRPTEEQRALQRVAHEFAAQELRPLAREWDEREDFPPDLLEKAARVGLTSYAVPSRYGGGGADSVTSALIAEELSWGCAGLAATIQATMFPVAPLVRFGTDGQRDHYLPMLAHEEGTLAAIAFTEAHAGTDLASIRATAGREDDGYVLDGEKVYVTNGGIADVTIVFAKLEGAMTAFVVGTVIGIVSEPFRQGLGLGRGVETGRTTLDNILSSGVPLKAGGTHIANEEVVHAES